MMIVRGSLLWLRRDSIGVMRHKGMCPLEEFELSALRARFLAVSEQIATELAALSSRIGDTPPALRA
jgi:redox-regulated HSP33 family molecular chaperone